jgi:hypothetical protein
MRPTRATRALAAIVRELVATGDGATYFAGQVWGVALRYDFGSSHPLVGRSVPDFELADGTRVATLLRDGRGLVLEFDRGASLRALASRWKERITYVGMDSKDRPGLRAVLVRPDGFVARASDAAYKR